jgi:hypothetical protein
MFYSFYFDIYNFFFSVEMWQSSKPPSFSNESTLFSKKEELLHVENILNPQNLTEKLNEKLSNMNITSVTSHEKSAVVNSHERFADRLNEKIPPKPRKLTPIFSRTSVKRKDSSVTSNNNNNNNNNSNNTNTKDSNIHNGNVLVDSLIIDDGNSTTTTTVNTAKSGKESAKKLRKDIQTITYHSNSDEDDHDKTNDADLGEESDELDLEKDNANKLVNLYNCNRGVQAIPNNPFDFIWDSQKFMSKLNEEDQKQQELQSTTKKIEEHVSSANAAATKSKTKASVSGKGPKLLSDDFKYVRNPEITIMLNLEKKKTKKTSKKKGKAKKSKSSANDKNNKSILSSASAKKLSSEGEILVGGVSNESSTLSNDINKTISDK